MELAKKLRLKIGQILLRKKLEKTIRKARYSDFSQVKKIGIIWDASRVQEFIHLTRFFQKMTENGIEVNVISYFNGKSLPDQYTAIRYLACIKREELTFFYLPMTNDAEQFIKNRFDILIDLNFNELLPLKYLSGLSAASFKVGLSGNDREGKVYDLMIDLKIPETGEFLDQTLHYLQMIHAETEVAH
ncbi:MAG TPA: hypothetical protein VK155_08570 [Bacteroidales bacterium]|jgi:hypothetical protein|nr:hypothetical protein [Bacteroidales bacterium]